MKTTVRYEFDNPNFFPKELDRQHSVVLTDPPVIPATADMIHLRMEEFFDSKALADAYSDHAEGKVFYAERLNTIIGRDHIEVLVILYEEEIFKKEFPRFFAE